MALSNTSKTGLALGAILPVLVSLYSETQKQTELQQQQQAARSELIKKQRDKAADRDLDTAQQLLQQIASEDKSKLCEHFYIASELVRLGTYSKATRHSLISALRYRPESAHDTRPRICDCPGTLEQMRVSWRPGLDNTASAAIIGEMAQGLDDAAALCAPTVVAAVSASTPIAPPASQPVMASPPPVAPRHSELPPAAMTLPPPPAMAMPPAEPASATDCPPLPAQPPAANIRIYLQIAEEPQRASAAALQRTLLALGYAVPGIELVGPGRSPRDGELRYVYSEDIAEARKLSSNAGIDRADCSRLFRLAPPMKQFRSKTPRNSFELWYPRGGAAPRTSP